MSFPIPAELTLTSLAAAGLGLLGLIVRRHLRALDGVTATQRTISTALVEFRAESAGRHEQVMVILRQIVEALGLDARVRALEAKLRISVEGAGAPDSARSGGRRRTPSPSQP